MTSDMIKHYVTPASAKAFVHKHKTGRQIFMRVTAFLYSELPNAEAEGGRGYDLPENVPVTQAAANKVFASYTSFAQRRFEKDGVELKILITLCDNCIFIG